MDALLSVSGKKTLQALAHATSLGPGALGGLRQFINGSTWDWRQSRRALADLVSQSCHAMAWTVGTVVIPKRGNHSVGVHRRFVPEVGRTVNCQLAYGLLLSTAHHSVPVDWHLTLDSSWLGDGSRRRRARIPEQPDLWAGHSHLTEFASSIADSPAGAKTPLVADLTRFPDIAPLVVQLKRHGIELMVRVSPAQRFRLSSGGGVRTAAEILASASCQSHVVTGAGPGPRQYQVAASSAAVQLPVSAVVSAPTYRLLTWKPLSAAPGVTGYWLTTLTDWRVSEVLSLTRHLGRTEMVARVLEENYGVLDFEGRSFPGWHHHMTMVSAAYAYACLRRPPVAGEPELPSDLSFAPRSFE